MKENVFEVHRLHFLSCITKEMQNVFLFFLLRYVHMIQTRIGWLNTNGFFIHNKNMTTSQNIVNTKNDLEEALCSSGLLLTLIQLSRMITEDWGNAVFRPVNYAHLCRKVFSFNLGILYICSKLVDSHRNMQYPIT